MPITPTAEGVYEVTYASQLAWIADQNDDFEGKTIVLTRNFDLNGKVWKPIGNAAKPFNGTFKGNGYLIKGLRLFEGTDGIGLFGHVGAKGRIETVGISGGTLVAKNKRRIGALAGVCAGSINQCWSMAQIAVCGDIAGGLVGELSATGSITDCYHSGLIINGADTLGGIVGYNSGKLTRVYNTGYAKNGHAIVGVDHAGSYSDCFYDRKLYYQQPGADHSGIKALDETAKMFDLFEDKSAWTTNVSDQLYPRLTIFAGTDAAKLSVVPLFISTIDTDTIDHANDLTKDFKLGTDGTIQWECQTEGGKEWIQISGEDVHVIRPCTETDVLVNSTLRQETRVVYLRPRRLDDFQSGSFLGTHHAFCLDEEVDIIDQVSMKPAELGWKYGEYHYRLTLSQIKAPKDTVYIKDLCADKITDDFNAWLIMENAKLPTDQAGEFVIRRFAHDEGCVKDWIRSEGEFIYIVFPKFDPGEITDGKDTIYLPVSPSDTTITIRNITSASGGGGPISYSWMLNGVSVSLSSIDSLQYTITHEGTYIFERAAQDSAGCYVTVPSQFAKGRDTIVVFEPFDPGEIQEVVGADGGPLTFCTVEDAKTYTIQAKGAGGGCKPYYYQWYRVNGTTETPIPGATNAYLSLSELTLVAGGDYTLIRRAKDDTRFTDFSQDQCLTRHQQKVHIMSTLDPGTIVNGAKEDYCLPHDSDPAASIHITVGEANSASGDASGLEYRWYRIGNGKTEWIPNSNTPTLDYTFPMSDIALDSVYSYIREVRNLNCDWAQSAGVATQRYGQETYKEVTFTVCDEDIPYTMKWIDGSTHTFNNHGEKWLVSDTRGICKADTLFIIHVTKVPEMDMDDQANLCQTTGSITLYFEQKEGTANVFHITYSPDLAAIIGMNDTTGIITAPGTIVLQNIPSIGNTGEHYMYLQIGYSGDVESGEGVCFSRRHRMDLTVSLGGYVYSKYDRVLFVDNNPENGALPEATEKLKFVSYQWYRNGIKQEGQTGQYYHEGGQPLNGVYFVEIEDTRGVHYRSCDVKMPSESTTTSSAPQHSAVYPIPVQTASQLTIEGDGKAQIISFTGELISQVVLTNGKTELSAPRVAGMYYVQITRTDGAIEMHKLLVK